MWKALLSCLIILGSIILLTTSTHAVSREEYISYHENRMITLCEDIYGDRDGTYGCLITEYYAIRKTSELLVTIPHNSADWLVLIDLFEEYRWPEYDTYDFMAIHLDFEKYLKDRINSRKGEGL